MSEFQDLNDYFDETLRLPIGGKTYVIEGPSADDGALIMALVSGALDGRVADVLNEKQETDLYRLALGPTYDELVADGISWIKLQHVGQTVVTWITAGETFAAAVWASPGGPGSTGKALKAPQDRRPKSSSRR